jgi:hypothetical protein
MAGSNFQTKVSASSDKYGGIILPQLRFTLMREEFAPGIRLCPPIVQQPRASGKGMLSERLP